MPPFPTARTENIASTVATLSQLKEMTERPLLIHMRGRSAPEDGAGGVFYWMPNDDTPADEALFVEPISGPKGRYRRVYTGPINDKWFGVKADGVTDDTFTLQAALNSGQDVLLSTGVRIVTAPIIIKSDGQEISGVGDDSVIRLTSSVFCALAVVERTVGVWLHDFRLEGTIETEPPTGPVRALVIGADHLGTSHSAVAWLAKIRISRIRVSGAKPGVSGFNVGIHLNRASHSRVEKCIVDSLLGTHSNYGHAVVCDASHTDIVDSKFLSTVEGQGRHAVYLTNTPSYSRVIDCYAEGFQWEAYTTNITAGGVGLAFINCTAKDCFATANGTTGAPFLLAEGASRGAIINCKVYGNKGSNRLGLSLSGPDHVVDGFYCENIWLHGIYALNCDRLTCRNVVIVGCSLKKPGTYGAVELEGGSHIDIANVVATAVDARFVVRFNYDAPPSRCTITKYGWVGGWRRIVENAGKGSENWFDFGYVQGGYRVGETRPSVASGVEFLAIGNSETTHITDLCDASEDQTVLLLFTDGNTEVHFEGPIDFAPQTGDTLTVRKSGSRWREVRRMAKP